MNRNSIFPASFDDQKYIQYLANRYYANCKMALNLYELNKEESNRGKTMPRLPKDDPRRRIAQTYEPGRGWRVNRWITDELFGFKKLFS